MNPHYQPYGQQIAAPGVGKRKTPPSFIFFGIVYMVIRGLMLVLGGLAMAMLVIAGRQAQLNEAGEALFAGTLVGLALVVVWFGYMLLAGILSLRGKLAGPIMGLIDGAGLLLVYMIGTVVAFATEQHGQGLVGMLIAALNAIIVAMAVRAIARRNKGRQGLQWQPAPGYRDRPAAYGLPPTPLHTKPLVPAKISKPQAVARILGAAVSADGMASEARLDRARAEALAMLGQQRAVLVNKELAAAPEINDLERHLAPLAQALGDPPNPALNQRILQSAGKVVAESGELDPLAEEFLNTLERALAGSRCPTI